MFYDLAELDHILDRLEYNAELSNNVKLDWINDSESEFNIRLTALMKAVYKRELKHGVKQGTSYQSGLLSELYYLLQICTKPSKLKAYLPELKDLLFKSMIISLDHRIDSLKRYSAAKRKASENWIKFDNQQPNKKRRSEDQLSKFLIEILNEKGKDYPTKSIWEDCRQLARIGNHPLIYEVDELSITNNCFIYWGKDKKTAFESFSNRISRLRKNLIRNS